MGRPSGCPPEELVSRALDVFSAKGYEATSIEDLVKATGVSRSYIYENFVDKHGLFLAALDLYKHRHREAAKALFSQPGPRLDRIRAYFEAVIVDGLQQKPKGCFMVNSTVELADTDPETAARASLHFSRMEELFVGFLREAQDNGEISQDLDLRATARFLLNTSRGMRTIVKLTQDEKVMRDIVRVAMTVLEPKEDAKIQRASVAARA
jgi:TetR/AcrR family transcriptional repressor of nem operon